ncbi:hypothetical protein J437_LFUL004718 [Ladona fulva]|uniref:Synaptic plasticity regulator PANTS n=1 Tax=Ladona fulva TaxID=123851 RepID=A0A8K0NW55_LADFU|nr:hypothetical protein J437_LFUL004718 [Ladona fulva]
MAKEERNETTEGQIIPYMWMVRPCLVYQEEYSDCKSIRGRFHQYFIHGETIDCNQWLRDSENCKRWEESKNLSALNSLIDSEKKRKTERLRKYVENDIWELRDEPPQDWNKPLPEWMEKEYSSTYLAFKSVERKSKTAEVVNESLCVIS